MSFRMRPVPCLRTAAITLLGVAMNACAIQPGLPSNDVASAAPATHPIVIGHRGASGYRPEHTLAAYALAIEQGADYVEPDVVATAEGVLIARHENAIGGTTDVAQHPEFANRKTTKTVDGEALTDWFTEDFTLAELKTLRAIERVPRLRAANTAFNGQFEVPTLTEIVALVRSANEKRLAAAAAQGAAAPRPVGLYIEIKHSSYFRSIGKPIEESLVALLHREGLDSMEAPVYVQSFETANLRMLKQMTRVRLSQLIAGSGAPFDFIAAGDPRTYADMTTQAGLKEIATYASGIGAAKELVIPLTEDGRLGAPTSLVKDAHQAGLEVHAWTFRRENTFLPTNLRSSESRSASGALDQEISAFLRTGVDGIFSDNPDIAVDVRRQMIAAPR